MDVTLPLSASRRVRLTDRHVCVYSGEFLLFSFALSSRIDLKVPDEDEEVIFSGESREGEQRVFTWLAKSPCWAEKRYVLSVCDDRVTYRIRVTGKGRPENILWLRGSGSARSGYHTAGYLIPQFQDVDHERARHLTGTDGTILPLRAAPPPFVFPFWNEFNGDQAGVGLAAPRGENNYERFLCRFGGENEMWFETPLLGYTAIDGQWESPTLWIGFGDSDMAVIRAYADWTRAEMGYPCPTAGEKPDWWKKPIFCGWGEQVLLSEKNGGDASGYSAQAVYERMMEELDDIGLKPGVVVIDDGWQTATGALEVDTRKWPSLRDFADRQHARGRKVLLWQHVWSPKRMDRELCVTKDGQARTVDPTNPRFLAYLKERIRLLLSDGPDGMNCDGFKLDYLDNVPRNEPGFESCEKGVYGLEMMRRLFEAYYRFAKEAKKDALINTSAIHPYFSDLCDQIRLHDYWGTTRCATAMMELRAEETRAVLPCVLIDTDHASLVSPQDAMMKSLADSRYGVPALYSLSNFTKEQLERIRENWETYEKHVLG